VTVALEEASKAQAIADEAVRKARGDIASAEKDLAQVHL